MPPTQRHAQIVDYVCALVASTLLASMPIAQTRIACLGDSITFGAGLTNREQNCYPAWLGEHLGSPYEVRNFGVGGATLLAKADRPYRKSKAFQRAVAWCPDIAIIILGTNDTCQNERRHNWQHADFLEADALSLIQVLQAARPSMRIVLASPTPMLANKPGLKEGRAQDLRERQVRIQRIANALQQAARQSNDVEYLELRSSLRAQDVTDGVHPTPFGAERLARRIAEAIASPQTTINPAANPVTAILRELGITNASTSFHSFPGVTFDLPKGGAGCRVIFPQGQARGTPWILRARFFGHQPALDIALLERGFHLVYCDVSNLYGSNKAMARWSELYELLVQAGLNTQVVLEGMSRGGLTIINWAAQHPDRVAAIYGDNPVADFRSWPGGKTGKRSAPDWQHCLNAYGLNEQTATSYNQMPVDRLAPIAKAKIPMLLVLGVDDVVVPIAENGDLIASRYRSLEGPIEVWRKPKQGHHPHGLHPVEPLLRAVLRATGFAQGVTTTAAPSVEYRSGAGWNGDSWSTQVAKMRQLAAKHPKTRMVLLGDSITQGLTGARNRRATPNGPRAIDKAFGKHGALSLGLSGDRTEHVLYRIQHGALSNLTPDVIVLQIGVNNIVTAKHTANETAGGIEAVLKSLATSQPQAHIILCGPFPAGKQDSATRQTTDRLHELIRHFGDESRVFYRDLRHLFINTDGTPNGNLRGDRIHITQSGQSAWMQAIAPLITQLLAP